MYESLTKHLQSNISNSLAICVRQLSIRRKGLSIRSHDKTISIKIADVFSIWMFIKQSESSDSEPWSKRVSQSLLLWSETCKILIILRSRHNKQMMLRTRGWLFDEKKSKLVVSLLRRSAWEALRRGSNEEKYCI